MRGSLGRGMGERCLRSYGGGEGVGIQGVGVVLSGNGNFRVRGCSS